jgi:hypothetical protein
LCGLIACVIGFRFFLYFLPSQITFFELIVNHSNPHIYTSILFNVGYLIFHIPFWFTIGTVFWLSIITPNLIGKISNNIPLRINPLQDIGGTEILGEILLKSNVSIGILALGVPVYFLRNQDIIDPTWIYYNIFLMSFFVVTIYFGFFHPLYPIHKKMKQNKVRELNDLIDKINYSKIKDGTASQEEVNLNLLRVELINKISSKNEWPFNFDIFIKIILLSFIPMVQLIVSIYSII